MRPAAHELTLVMESVPFFLRWRLLKWLGVMFFLSMFTSCTELRYLAFGRRTQGEVIAVSRWTQLATSPPGDVWQLKYVFQDQGNIRREQTHLYGDAASPPTSGGKVEIEYIPRSEGMSRLAGQRDNLSLGFFFGCLGLIVSASIFLAWRDRRIDRPRPHPRR